MPCDHKGGPELIEMAEAHLRQHSVSPDRWPGLRFRWAENLTDSMWASVIVEVLRRDAEWVVVRLDRRQDPLPDGETGFREV